MTPDKTICFVTPGHLSHNPRLYKEAYAANEAGYNVRIIANQSLDWVSEYDALLLRKHPKWEFVSIRWDRNNWRPQWLRIKSGTRQRLSKIGFKSGIKNFAEAAFGRVYPELLSKAVAKDADLFIGHNLAALPVVAGASEKYGRPFGFDLEDAYFAEGRDGPKKVSPVVEYIEKKYLSKAAFLTASSPFIAGAYRERYGLDQPHVILNVFPWKDRQSLPEKLIYKDLRDPNRISLYWFSQTVGLDRGLQDIISALVILNIRHVELHIRGKCDDSIKRKLLQPVQGSPLLNQIYFHPQVSPNELLARTVEHDIGLALEPGKDLNNWLAISNKIFLYLLAGLSIIATETEGQMGLMNQLQDVGFHYKPGDISCLADQLKLLLEDKDKLQRYKKNSLRYAETKFNWEMESKFLLACLEKCL